MNRCQLLRALELEREWDVIVVGGGATGLGVAVDAATRGLRTVLLEANDFAKGTSSRSTKLVHGGVRYLEQAIFRWSWKHCGKGACSIGTRPILSITSPLLFLATNGGRDHFSESG
jgi:Glycerol-3-phosphate dehydrogenase